MIPGFRSVLNGCMRTAVLRIIGRGKPHEPCRATFYSGDVWPDFALGSEWGVAPLSYRAGQNWRDPGESGAIGAWAWDLSRAMDYFETDKEIDHRRVSVMGHSRMGRPRFGRERAIRGLPWCIELLRRWRRYLGASKVRGVCEGAEPEVPVVVLRELREVSDNEDCCR
ncbi:MAG: 4-O-methyl-glucuronoyl methylesterase [Bryobacterales bacterium]|nr:4-O-methyl-glucuronoyl methylesterase [Bryobacterales bacterium]